LPCNCRRAFPLLRLAFPLGQTTRSLHLKNDIGSCWVFSQPIAGQPQQTLQRIAKMVHATESRPDLAGGPRAPLARDDLIYSWCGRCEMLRRFPHSLFLCRDRLTAQMNYW
jgi:hypothetical protein